MTGVLTVFVVRVKFDALLNHAKRSAGDPYVCIKIVKINAIKESVLPSNAINPVEN